MGKVLFWRSVYKWHDLNDNVIEGNHESIRKHLRGYTASRKTAHPQDLAFHATSLLNSKVGIKDYQKSKSVNPAEIPQYAGQRDKITWNGINHDQRRVWSRPRLTGNIICIMDDLFFINWPVSAAFEHKGNTEPLQACYALIGRIACSRFTCDMIWWDR